MLQSWNKFCFRGGIIEFNVSFPGDAESSGFWAAGWTSETPSYLIWRNDALLTRLPAQWAILVDQVTWHRPRVSGRTAMSARISIPFCSHCAHMRYLVCQDACDVGTLPNQTYADDSSKPEAALDGEYVAQLARTWISPEAKFANRMSYLPGQRLSSCTCQGEDHPGPKKANGSFVARSAPEIDLWEVAADHSSQSFQLFVTLHFVSEPVS